MNFTNLQYFLEIAKELNMSNVARRMHVSQQSLSHHIKNLEDELGTLLFERKPLLKLTPAGICLANASTQILDVKNAALREISIIAEARPSRLRVCVSRARTEAMLPTVLSLFYSIHPQTYVEISEGNAQFGQKGLEEGTIDIAVCVNPKDPNLVNIELMEENMYIVVSRSYLNQYHGNQTNQVIESLYKSFDFNYLRNMPFILLNKGSMVRACMDAIFLEGQIVPRAVLEMKDIRAALEIVRHGFGVTLYPDLFLRHQSQYAQKGEILYFPVGNYGMLTACYNPKFPVTSEILSFIDCVKEWLSTL